MLLLTVLVNLALVTLGAGNALAATERRSEIDLVLPDLASVAFLGIDGHTLLLFGLGVCVLGLVFGLVIYGQLKNLPVHRSMLEISELIYETCKTYLITQGRFILILWLFIGAIMVISTSASCRPCNGEGGDDLFSSRRHRGQLSRSLVRHPHQHVRQLARTAFAALEGKPFPCYAIR
jgi:K(+)-stimulated pyrophosphate-energized sodium pump